MATSVQEKANDGNEKEISEISEIIENSDIDEGDKERIIGYMREEFRGPLPHPQILKQYEDIQPGFASEIMNMALKEQEYRHEIEKTLVDSEVSLNLGQLEVINASIKLKTRLQIFGFVSTIILLVVGSVCIFLDKNVGSIGPFILAIGSFCWTMFYGKKNDKEDKSSDETEEGTDDDN
jgi:uncharacterized membrane protein